MVKALIAPGKYVQGAGALPHLGERAAGLGKKALVVGSPTALKQAQQQLLDGLGAIKATVEEFNRECSKTEIKRLQVLAKKEKCDFVIGFGGGKAIDTAKAVAHYLKKPVAVVPALATTGAPCTALSVIYTDDGVFEEYLVLPQNPELVLLDTNTVAHAPARFLVAGMGDALGTKFAAQACAAGRKAALSGGYATISALTLADLCYETLLEFGVAARTAVENNAVCPALERAVEANTLLSGLGFESGGLAAAHAIHNGLTVLEQTHSAYHGEKVAFGTLAQLVMEDKTMGEIEEVLDFCHSVGLPTTLAGLGVPDLSSDEIMKVAQAATAEGETIHNEPFPVTVQIVFDALLSADALGRSFGGGS